MLGVERTAMAAFIILCVRLQFGIRKAGSRMTSKCEIDYCELDSSKTLTINVDGQFLAMGFCLRHAMQLEEKLREMTGKEVDLSGLHFGTAGELTEAIEYVCAANAARYERRR
jgi:hypothetical protein